MAVSVTVFDTKLLQADRQTNCFLVTIVQELFSISPKMPGVSQKVSKCRPVQCEMATSYQSRADCLHHFQVQRRNVSLGPPIGGRLVRSFVRSHAASVMHLQTIQ